MIQPVLAAQQRPTCLGLQIFWPIWLAGQFKRPYNQLTAISTEPFEFPTYHLTIILRLKSVNEKIED